MCWTNVIYIVKRLVTNPETYKRVKLFEHYLKKLITTLLSDIHAVFMAWYRILMN
jgi:hypothetical protein